MSSIPSSSQELRSVTVSMLTCCLLFSFSFIYASHYTWDTGIESGFQAGDGIWSGSSTLWTTDGSSLVAWPGAGNSATFAGHDGTWTVTINEMVKTDSIAFLSGGYILGGGGTLTAPAIYVAERKTDTIGAIIGGGNGLTKSGTGRLVLSAANTYSGATVINGGNIRFYQLADGGAASSIGSSGSDAANLVINSGHLEYTYGKVDASTDRLFTIGTAQCSLNVSMATVHFTNTGAIALSGSADRTFCLGGNGTAIFTPVIGDNGGATSLQKFGSGTWILTGDHTYTGVTDIRPGNNVGTLQIGDGGTQGSISGTSEIRNASVLKFNRSDRYVCNSVISGDGELIQAGTGILVLNADNNTTDQTTVSAGTLLVNGSLDTERPVKVENRATLGGTGSCSGADVAGGGTIAPGESGAGTLMLNALNLSAGAIISLDIGTPDDLLILTGEGRHTLEGTVIVRESTGFTTGTFRIITYSGSLSGGTHSLTIGRTPDGYDCFLSSGDGYIDLIIEGESGLPLITDQSGDTTLIAGGPAVFQVTAQGNDLSYVWISTADGDDTLSQNAEFIIPAVSASDSGRSFVCHVSNSRGTVVSDTITILNVLFPVTITGQSGSQTVAIGDTARFFLTATGSGPLDFRWYRLETGDDSLISSESAFTIDGTVMSDSGRYYCIISNSVSVDTSDTMHLIISQESFTVPVHLGAEALSSTSVHLTWNAIDTTANDAIIIRYSKNTIDTGMFTAEGGCDSVSCLNSDTATIITGLSPDTRYCFVLQTAWGSLRSLITTDSRIFCSTLPADNPSVLPNSIVIDTVYYDSLTGSFRLSWCIDPAAFEHEDLQVAFTCGFSQYPDEPREQYIINQKTSCADTFIQVYPMRFDTLCYCAFRLRSDGGSWSEPTPDSRGTVRITGSFRQILPSLYSVPVNDTLDAFNGSVLLWKDAAGTGTTTGSDTVEVFMPDTVPEGMIVVSRPFCYKRARQSLPVDIGIRIDSLPAGKTLDDVLIYTYFAGIPSVCYGTETVVEQGMVHVETERTDRPFMAMIDTVPPRVEILSDTGTLVFSGSELVDSIRIHDNIANVRWTYDYGSGDWRAPLRQENASYRTGNQITLTVADTVSTLCSGAGLRACLTVTDGRNRNTINMSRSVQRQQSDAFITEENVWIPVYATAVLKNASGDSLLGRLPCVDSIGYDKRFVRFYRWGTYGSNGSAGGRWVEYAPEDDRIRSFFTLNPGTLVWLKTLGSIPVHLGSARTLSLKDTFSVELPSAQWTDFGMPYRFGVSVEEIVSASGSGAEQVQFHQWTTDSISRRYMLEPLYVPGMSDHNDRSETVDYVPKGGYSLYNRSAKPVLLRIPPVTPEIAGTMNKLTAHRTDGSAWSGKFVAQSGEGARLPAVYFGYSPDGRQSAFPVPPSFALLRLSVFDRKTKRYFGHAIDNSTKEGLIRELVIRNISDSVQTIQYHFERTGNFPEHYSIFCFDAVQMSFDTIGSLTIPPESQLSRWVVVGDEAYQRTFISTVKPMKYLLDAPFPNPARSFVNIRYHVPFGAQERIRISIYSILGQRIWTRQIDGPLSAGFYNTVWKGRDCSGKTVSAGVYIVLLTVTGQQNGSVRQFNRQITLMR